MYVVHESYTDTRRVTSAGSGLSWLSHHHTQQKKLEYATASQPTTHAQRDEGMSMHGQRALRQGTAVSLCLSLSLEISSLYLSISLSKTSQRQILMT